MDKSEEVFVSLFSRLREDLREEFGVGLCAESRGSEHHIESSEREEARR